MSENIEKYILVITESVISNLLVELEMLLQRLSGSGLKVNSKNVSLEIYK